MASGAPLKGHHIVGRPRREKEFVYVCKTRESWSNIPGLAVEHKDWRSGKPPKARKDA